ncbi:LamG-like jellyroll fold domain-containing protein [Nonomuraea sp. NEAU-A123]|uniref:LamG-like jellyroll fold domain-containing protein n=1 Tax=Nonomuraea sp. NEAU-A123 TaxID=2839649 RepID=UPI001BE4C641|nr:LamG-like jellyroll fold domain-containing protein [Nonomuraea sp. NEAU-A123]MBT2235639.1 Ig-like domain-containing protein [Nonomuraea sp. NEAU-A123]
MKKAMRAGLLPATLTIALTTGVPTAAATADPPAPELVYEFDTDDISTGSITDSSGNGLNGTLVNGSTAALVAGAGEGHALSLPGGSPNSDGAYVQVPLAAIKGKTDLTVSARVKWDGTTAPWQWIYALGKDTSRYLFSTPFNNDGRLRTAITSSYGGGEAQVTGSAPLPANAWKTLTVTLDTAAKRITTYLDGAAVGSAATTVTAADLIDATTTSAGFIGRSFYPDPLFDGAIDDFRVYAAALSPEQVAAVVGGEVPTPTGLAENTFAVRTIIGTAPALPATVRATFSDGYDRELPITWSPVNPGDYAAAGSFTVTGTAGGRPVTATVTVIREGQLAIDLGKDTGPFHGGASGTLYGLYGPGVPTNNLIEGMRLRTVSTKAQDGAQHPGADALEVVKPLADSTDGDVYIYMTDIHRGFPYQWPGSTPQEKLDQFKQKIAKQVDQALQLDPKYQDNIVFVPFNEPEGNMFGTGEWSYNGVSWLSDPRDYFQAWDDVYALIKGRMPAARIAGPNTSVLYAQVKGYLEHAVKAGTVPDVLTWHELSHPEQVRESVKRYREMEAAVFAGTKYAGKKLPINVNEYAFNYHTSVPGQMIQWVSAIEESKIDADIAYWNIDGNLSDSAVQANRGNGQWWLFNAYGSMSGHTVPVTPPYPGQNYTLQGVATLDPGKRQARAIFGGADSAGHIRFENVPADPFGRTVHAWVREIPWTGQIGDSAQPEIITEHDVAVKDGTVVFDFGSGDLPRLKESSAYEIVLTPAGSGTATSPAPKLWERSYEAEDAKYTGTGYSRNGPEGSPADVSKFYTSGRYNVGGLRTGSDGVLDFTVEVPRAGRYDLGVFANSLNTFDRVREQGPTNVFVRVDGAAEQELFLPLGYKWVVWDHADTTVELTAGKHLISLAARSLDGAKVTKGDAIVDRILLSLPNPAAATSTYEAELADLRGARTSYSAAVKGSAVSGSGGVEAGRGQSATFWVYSAKDTAAALDLKMSGSGRASVTVNGLEVMDARRGAATAAVSLSGGINKVTVTGKSGTSLIDRLDVRQAVGALPATVYEAEAAQLAGTAKVAQLSLASGKAAVTDVGGAPGNDSTLTFKVQAAGSGTYALRIRYANPEQSAATHYNPDPLARHADISVNGGAAQRVLFPHSFHENNFWELTVPVKLKKGENTLRFSSAELPNFDGTTYASQTFPGVLLRSQYAPVIDKITVAPFSKR